MTGVSRESSPASPPLASPTSPVTSASPDSSPTLLPASPVQQQQQQQQPRVSSAVTTAVSQRQGGLGQRHGLVSMLAAGEDIAMGIADQSPPHVPDPKLPLRPASELVTLAALSDLWV